MTVYPSSYRPTLILMIIPGATGVATGHFEDKAIAAYCHSESFWVLGFIFLNYRPDERI
jgi:hypothetical protein